MRSIVLAGAMSLAIIAAVEVAFRSTGGTPSISLGKTPVEFQWKLRHAEANRLIYVIGDSRVEWGFGEVLFNEELSRRGVNDVRGLNAGFPGGAAAALMKFILDNHKGPPGVMAVNYSACGFFRWAVAPGEVIDNLKLQDLLDDRVRTHLKQVLYTYDRERGIYKEHLKTIMNGGYKRDVVWYKRDVLPEGFIQVRGRYNDGTSFEPKEWSLAMYDEQLGRMCCEMDKCARRREELLEVAARAHRAGWRVVLIRMPIGPSQYQKEQSLPSHLLMESLASDMGVPAFDYQHDPRVQPLETYDESHLSTESARVMARVLASDFVDYLAGRQPPPLSRQPQLAGSTVRHKPSIQTEDTE